MKVKTLYRNIALNDEDGGLFSSRAKYKYTHVSVVYLLYGCIVHF